MLGARPYVGGSFDASAVGNGAGFGVDIGLRWQRVYSGLEAGLLISFNPLYTTIQYMAPLGGEPASSNGITFYGLHAGIIIDSDFFLGAVVLLNQQYWQAGNDLTIRHSFNVGPDFRAKIEPTDVLIMTAYTIQRGVKFGVGYIF